MYNSTLTGIIHYLPHPYYLMHHFSVRQPVQNKIFNNANNCWHIHLITFELCLINQNRNFHALCSPCISLSQASCTSNVLCKQQSKGHTSTFLLSIAWCQLLYSVWVKALSNLRYISKIIRYLWGHWCLLCLDGAGIANTRFDQGNVFTRWQKVKVVYVAEDGCRKFIVKMVIRLLSQCSPGQLNPHINFKLTNLNY